MDGAKRLQTAQGTAAYPLTVCHVSIRFIEVWLFFIALDSLIVQCMSHIYWLVCFQVGRCRHWQQDHRPKKNTITNGSVASNSQQMTATRFLWQTALIHWYGIRSWLLLQRTQMIRVFNFCGHLCCHSLHRDRIPRHCQTNHSRHSQTAWDQCQCRTTKRRWTSVSLPWVLHHSQPCPHTL
jgi:hypothetical protein